MNPFKFLVRFATVAALSAPVLVGCATETETDPSATDSTEDQLTVCNAGSKTAWQNGRNIGAVRLMKIDDKLTTIKTGHAYLKLKRQMAARGVTLSINSGFRTNEEQRYFYNCYINKNCNGGNEAARPGYSNHQHGRALDIQISNHTKFKQGIRALGLSNAWKNTVRGERWHWEYFGTDPGGICNADSAEEITATDDGALDTSPVQAEGDQTFEGEGEDFSDENIPDDESEAEDGQVETAHAH